MPARVIPDFGQGPENGGDCSWNKSQAFSAELSHCDAVSSSCANGFSFLPMPPGLVTVPPSFGLGLFRGDEPHDASPSVCLIAELHNGFGPYITVCSEQPQYVLQHHNGRA